MVVAMQSEHAVVHVTIEQETRSDVEMFDKVRVWLAFSKVDAHRAPL